MLDVGLNGFVCNNLQFKDLDKELLEPTDKRIFAIALALQKGYSVEKIHQLTKITPWFLYKMKNIIDVEKRLIDSTLDEIDNGFMLEAKRNGFSDIPNTKIVVFYPSVGISDIQKHQMISQIESTSSLTQVFFLGLTLLYYGILPFQALLSYPIQILLRYSLTLILNSSVFLYVHSSSFLMIFSHSIPLF